MNIIQNYRNKYISNFTTILWNVELATKFIQKEYPEYLDFFNHQTSHPIIKCDFFRYLLMYHFGGIYTDLDFIPLKPLNSFFQEQIEFNKYNIILSEEWNNSTALTNTLHNGILISKSKFHPFWMHLLNDIIDSFNSNVIITTNSQVFDISGTKKICQIASKIINNFQDITIIPYFLFCPYIAILNDNVKNNINEYVICNGKNKVPSINDSVWLSWLSTDHHKIKTNCPNSYFVSLYLVNGSMWK